MSDVNSTIAPYRDRVGGPIAALRAVVAEHGHIDAAAQEAVAELFNISRAEVRGIVSFYSDLRTDSPAETVVRICQAEACQAVGCRSLTRALETALGTTCDAPEPGAPVAIESVYCLGLCANGPAAMVGDDLVVSADVESIKARFS